ncbi:MAG: hypothetical protein H0U16_04280, partial [Actinobacteria bacterium]|nr:hypothetical protein [Actinomycetota bacterium]
YRQAVERERILRRAAAALGGAQTHDDIYQAAIEAATELCADIADAEGKHLPGLQGRIRGRRGDKTLRPCFGTAGFATGAGECK